MSSPGTGNSWQLISQDSEESKGCAWLEQIGKAIHTDGGAVQYVQASLGGLTICHRQEPAPNLNPISNWKRDCPNAVTVSGLSREIWVGQVPLEKGGLGNVANAKHALPGRAGYRR